VACQSRGGNVQLLRRRSVGSLIFLIIIGSTLGAVGAVGAWSAYQASLAASGIVELASAASLEAQETNQSSKADRLELTTGSISLASVDPAGLVADEPLVPKSVPTITTGRLDKPTAAATPRVDEKGKRLPPPPGIALPAHALLGESQIASLKHRLKLTAEQLEYWPAVEAALIEVVRLHARNRRGRAARIDPDSPEVQRLIFAATPLIMRLRDDQKREVRMLARVIGLEKVASQI
jgi:hypothetical protein